MFTKNFAAVFSTLLLVSSVASAAPSDAMAVVPAAGSVVDVNVQACEKPAYPARWVNDGASGNVVMDVLVGADGTVLESKVVQSSGYTRVDRASVRAVEQCKLKVSTQGTPARSRLTYAWVIE